MSDLTHLPGAVHVAPDKDALFDDLADRLSSAAQQAISQRGVFHLALSGGGTPEPFYVKLVTDPRYRHLPWVQTHVWLVDERRVPDTDKKSNIRMIREAMTNHAEIPAEQVHAVPTQADDPAAGYESEMREIFSNVPPEGFARMDFMLLGMGGDAHTASLFPHSPALSETGKWVANNDGEQVVPPPRITLTYPVLNAARLLVVLAVGDSKAETLSKIDRQLAEAPDPENLPITGVDPKLGAEGEMLWFLDAPAAGQDPDESIELA